MEKKLYDILGGAEPLEKLVTEFYKVMKTSPETVTIWKMHDNPERAHQKLFDFLSGWLGGPDLFVQKYGHPRLRARHLPFKISELERDQWLFCMAKALENCQISDDFKQIFWPAIARLADHMRNQI